MSITKEHAEEFVGKFVIIKYKGYGGNILNKNVFTTRLFQGNIGFGSKKQWLLDTVEIGKGMIAIPLAIENILEVKEFDS